MKEVKQDKEKKKKGIAYDFVLPRHRKAGSKGGEMKTNIIVTITLGEILEKYDWDAFCEIQGWNPYCVNEGLAYGTEEVELEYHDAITIGIPKDKILGKKGEEK